MTLPASGPLAMTDIQTEFGGTNPIGLNEYYAGGGLVPAGTSGTYGAVPSSGALSVQNFYGTSNFIPVYIEELFSTYLYTGNGSTQTITNGIDLAGEGGLVWIKKRDSNIANTGHILEDTERGANYYLSTNSTNAESYEPQNFSFNSDGFSMDVNNLTMNYASSTYASWTFRKQPKFFDVVTYTGNGVAGRQISHALGSVPGCMIIKKTSTGGSDWAVWNRGASTQGGKLNSTDAFSSTWYSEYFGSSQPTSTTFTIGDNGDINGSGQTYVAYLFAHDAGGFGLNGTDNVVSCGSLTADGSGAATVNLGYEAQWVLVKRTDNTQDWLMNDVMRGMSLGSFAVLYPNTSGAEASFAIPNIVFPTSTGFGFGAGALSNSGQYIYIAIRRGPMKVPESGTSVFNTVARTGTGATATVTAGFPVDMYLMQRRPTVSFPNIVDRLRGNTRNIQTYQTDAETATTNTVTGFDNMTGAVVGADTPGYVNESGITYANQMFRRAPGFFDEVCYTVVGSPQTVSHNLGVAPELVIVKNRSASSNWEVWLSSFSNPTENYLNLNTNREIRSFLFWGPMTSTTIGLVNNTPGSPGDTAVAYLFASCPGVSKVGSYTGTGTTQVINCGFTGGARFVLIKRTDSTGDWYVWDSARGIVAGNDSYLLLNSTAAEVTSTDYIDTYSAGFEITSTAPAAINANGGTFIFLAIA